MAPDFSPGDVGLPNVEAGGSALQTILGTAFLIIGAVAVIFIIVAGIQYITSAGNPERAKRAKDTILYAIIGLVVALFATVIVSFVVGRV